LNFRCFENPQKSQLKFRDFGFSQKSQMKICNSGISQKSQFKNQSHRFATVLPVFFHLWSCRNLNWNFNNKKTAKISIEFRKNSVPTKISNLFSKST